MNIAAHTLSLIQETVNGARIRREVDSHQFLHSYGVLHFHDLFCFFVSAEAGSNRTPHGVIAAQTGYDCEDTTYF